MKLWNKVLAAALTLSLAGFARAEQPDLVTLGVGSWETLRAPDRKAEIDIDYRWGKPFWWILRPQAGALIAGDGDYYVFGGVMTDLTLGRALGGIFVITLTSSIGGYGGGGYNLGSHFEFRNGGDLAYQFDSGWRAGLGFYHISNAGITRENGGSESALFQISMPVNW